MSNIYRKLWQWSLLVIVMSGSIVSCRSAAADEEKAFKAALLLPRVVDADGWTRAGYKGLLLIEEKLDAEIAYTENIPKADFERVFRQYAQEGFDFIIGHGGQFVPAAKIVAEEFPRTRFAVTTKYGGNNKNLGALSVRSGEMGYLAGVIAALKTTTKRIAYIGGQAHAGAQEVELLFERGAHTIDPTISISTEWVGNWRDEARAIELAQKQIDAGADVLAVNTGMAGLAVHPMAEQAGIYTVGWIEDQYTLAPKAVIASMIQDMPVLLVRGAELAHARRWEGRQYKFGLREGVHRLAPFRGMLSKEQEARVQAVQHGIIQGKIDLAP